MEKVGEGVRSARCSFTQPWKIGELNTAQVVVFTAECSFTVTQHNYSITQECWKDITGKPQTPTQTFCLSWENEHETEL